MTDTFTKNDILTIATQTNVFQTKLNEAIKCIGLLLSEPMLMIPSDFAKEENFKTYCKDASLFIISKCPEIVSFMKKLEAYETLSAEAIQSTPGYDDLPKTYEVSFSSIKKAQESVPIPPRKRVGYGSFFIDDNGSLPLSASGHSDPESDQSLYLDPKSNSRVPLIQVTKF